jgi:hypothetical protein
VRPRRTCSRARRVERTLTLSNVGDQPLSPPTLALSSADPAQVEAFTFETACSAPLALGEECSVTLRFAPTVAVPHAATLKLSSPGSEPTSVLLLGEALVPGSLVIAPAAGSSTEFGDVAIGASSIRSFTLTNPGAVPSGPLTITTDNNQFDVALGDCAAGDLVDGSSCTFSVTLTPTDSFAAAANVSVQSPGAGGAGIAIAGRGRQKAALAATGNRDLGRAYVGQAGLTAPENRFRPTLTGQRTARITVSDPVAMLSAPLALTGLGVQLVGPGQSCTDAGCRWLEPAGCTESVGTLRLAGGRKRIRLQSIWPRVRATAGCASGLGRVREAALMGAAPAPGSQTRKRRCRPRVRP